MPSDPNTAAEPKTEMLTEDERGWTARVTANGMSRIVRVGKISALIKDKSHD